MITSLAKGVTDLGPRNMVERRMEAGPDGLRFDRQMRNAFFDIGPAVSTLTSRILGARLHTEEPTESHRVLVRLGVGAKADGIIEPGTEREVATSRFEAHEEAEATGLVMAMNNPEALARANNVLAETRHIYGQVGMVALISVPLATGLIMQSAR